MSMQNRRLSGPSYYLRGRLARGPFFGSRSSSRPWEQAPLVPEPPSPPLGSVLATINKNELVDLATSIKDNKAKITDCTVVGSYNWLDKGNPTILVPGEPPAWTPVSNPVKLPEDSGTYFRDQNAARHTYPLQPAIEAVLNQDASFESTNVDVVACGSTLGNLLRFVQSKNTKFRILIEAIGATVFFLRRENSPTQTIPDVRGFGHTFPEANTTWGQDVKGSESHQRVLRYNFAGLNCLVRFEADGYLPGPGNTADTVAETGAEAGRAEQLASALQDSNVSSRAVEKTQNLFMKNCGNSIPQSDIFDLKTRSFRRRDDNILSEQIPRLWVSQVPNFVIGFHKSGLFDDIRVMNVREDIEKWEREQEGSLKKLAGLLKSLIDFALGQPDGRFELVHVEGEKCLELREIERDVNRVLPDMLKDRWVEGAVGHGYSDDEDGDYEDEHGDSDEGESLNWDSGSEKDYTACSASDCGYCGHCKY